jgi:hypothetical protein
MLKNLHWLSQLPEEDLMGPEKLRPFKTEVPPMRTVNSSRAKRMPQGILDALLRQFAYGAGNESVVGFLRVGAMGVVLAFLAANAVGGTNDTGSTAFPAEPRQWSVSVSWENDMFGGTDRFYTDGFRSRWPTPDPVGWTRWQTGCRGVRDAALWAMTWRRVCSPRRTARAPSLTRLIGRMPGFSPLG